MKKAILTSSLLILCLLGRAQINHITWDGILKKFVDQKGDVNYTGLKNDRMQFDAYLDFLKNNHPKASWTPNEAKAYWINAYNAFTVQIVLDNYPVKSIKDIGGIIYKVNTTWDVSFIKINGEELTLNDIEHKKLRGQFDDPRIHVAVNCASFSCPKLRNEAYLADKLESQLDDQAFAFVNNPLKNDLSNPLKPKISEIFNWYAGDFEKDGNTVIAFINKYGNKKIPTNTKLFYMEYNWSLNEMKK
ncbi:MAG: DUF547 domain-containing protein [Flavobacteriales bacterium]|nr:DUF547 domain-containing protein [Flavobacteriales bacterium]